MQRQKGQIESDEEASIQKLTSWLWYVHVHEESSIQEVIVGATVSDFGLPWDLLAEIDFLV